MKSVFEAMGGTYRQCGDYLIPDISLPNTETTSIGKYGRMRQRYLYGFPSRGNLVIESYIIHYIGKTESVHWECIRFSLTYGSISL